MAELQMKYLAGDLSLDFINTVEWTSGGLTGERLQSYDDLVRWAEGASLLSRNAASRLRAQAAAQRPRARTALATAKRIRALLRRVLTSFSSKDSKSFDALVARAARHRHVIAASGGRARWMWNERDLDSMLWPVVWAAAELLTSEDAASIRVCGGQDCGWMFVDRSRNGLRRWCEMSTCGTREKSRRRAAH